MRVWVSIPFEFYSALLERCQIKSPEYTFLRNGAVDGRMVVILSEADRANKFIIWAQQFYSDAADRITINPDIGRPPMTELPEEQNTETQVSVGSKP